MAKSPTRPLEDRPAVLLRVAWANILDGCDHSADQQLNELALLFDSTQVLARYNNPEVFSTAAVSPGPGIGRCEISRSPGVLPTDGCTTFVAVPNRLSLD